MRDPSSPDGDTDRPASDRADGGRQQPHAPDGASQRLMLTCVSYDHAPDRATVHPPDATGVERMEAWLTVDLSAVADRSAWR